MLAWRRSTLSLCAATLIVGRLSIEDTVPALVVGTLAALLLAIWTGAVVFRRSRWRQAPMGEPTVAFLLRDGRLPALMAAVAAGLCLVVMMLALGLLP